MSYTQKLIRKKVPVESIGDGLKDFGVLIGFLGSTAERSDSLLNNPTLAYIHENGSPAANIPPRPFLGPGVEQAIPQLSGLLVAGARQAVGGDQGAANRALQQVGIVGAGAVQAYMTSGEFAPLRPETIRRKGSSRPLIDTGQLRQAVTYSVRPKKGIKQEPMVVSAGVGPKTGGGPQRKGPSARQRAEAALRRAGIDPRSTVREDTDLGF